MFTLMAAAEDTAVVADTVAADTAAEAFMAAEGSSVVEADSMAEVFMVAASAVCRAAAIAGADMVEWGAGFAGCPAAAIGAAAWPAWGALGDCQARWPAAACRAIADCRKEALPPATSLPAQVAARSVWAARAAPYRGSGVARESVDRRQAVSWPGT